MTHAKLKLNQHPVRAGTRAEYTASLNIIEIVSITPPLKLSFESGNGGSGSGDSGSDPANDQTNN